MSEYDAEYDKLLQKLDKNKCTFEQVVSVHVHFIVEEYVCSHIPMF